MALRGGMVCFTGVLSARCLLDVLLCKGVKPLAAPPRRAALVLDVVIAAALFWWLTLSPAQLSPGNAAVETKKLLHRVGRRVGRGRTDTERAVGIANVSLTHCTQLPLRTKGGQPHPESSTLEKWASKGYSQLGADGVIHKLFSDLGTTNKYYVEFGTESGRECNTRRLREVCGWTGLLMDGDFENAMINQHREWITRENIVSLLRKYGVPPQPDLLSVDIDGNDFHVLAEILRDGNYRPRVVLVETTFALHEPSDMVAVYEPAHRWDGTCYSSASTLAFVRLARAFGYSVVGAHPPDLYWVRDDVLEAARLHAPYTHTNDVPKLRAHALFHNRTTAATLHARCMPVFWRRGWQTSEEVIHRERDAEAPIHKATAEALKAAEVAAGFATTAVELGKAPAEAHAEAQRQA